MSRKQDFFFPSTVLQTGIALSKIFAGDVDKTAEQNYRRSLSWLLVIGRKYELSEKWKKRLASRLNRKYL